MNPFSTIKNQLSIVDVISTYATLKKVGNYYKGVCPFHHEKTASFTVSPHKEIFYCFGCHCTGDVIEFIAKIEHCSPVQALNFLVERYKLTPPSSLLTDHSIHSFEEKKRYQTLHETVSYWAHGNLIHSRAVMQYLKERGISHETITLFSLGYFPKGTEAIKQLIQHIKKHNFLLEDLMTSGIVGEGKIEHYSPFEQRILFPIKDPLGRVVGFGGRIFVKHDERAKYYNSRENNNFIKGSILFGLDLAKPHIQKEEQIFLVEGYMDCITMVQHGFLTTVATLGTACTIEQLKLIARYAKTVFVIYDGDAAGRQAMMRLTQLCWHVNLTLKIIILPPGHDPASLLHQGLELKKYINKAYDIFSFIIQTLATDFFRKTVEEKMAIIQEFIKIIEPLQDPIKRELILQQAAAAFNIPLSTIKQSIVKQSKLEIPEKKIDGQKIDEIPLLEQFSNLEKKIFSVIINEEQGFQQADQNRLLLCLPEPLKELYRRFIATQAEKSERFKQFFETLNPEEKKLVTALALHYDNSQGESFNYLMNELQKKYWKKTVLEIKKELQQLDHEQNKETVEKILLQFQHLRETILPKD